MGKETAHINQSYDRQLENIQAQNAWQSSENDIDRNWQANEWARQFEQQVNAQRQMYAEQLHLQRESDLQKWRQQFEAENQYNSPMNQVARLMAAGINPAAAASQIMSGNSGSLGAGSSSSPSAASAPTGGTVGSHSVSPLGVGIPQYSTDSALFSSAAQLADSLSKLGQYGLASERQKVTLAATLDNLIADTKNKQEQAAITRVQQTILSATGNDKVRSEIFKAYADSYAAYQKGDYDKAQSGINQLLADIEKGRYNLDVEKQPYVISSLKEQANMYKSQQTANYASAGASNASARLSNALASTEDALRNGKVTAQQYANDLSYISMMVQERENRIASQTEQANIQRIIDNAKQQNLLTDIMAEQLYKAVQENDWTAFDHIVQGINQVGNSSPVKIGVSKVGVSK